RLALSLDAEALSALTEGETIEGLSILRGLVRVKITLKELARHTGLGEKSLHRMLNRSGNPTAKNLGAIIRSIAKDLGIRPRVKLAARSGRACAGLLPALPPNRAREHHAASERPA